MNKRIKIITTVILFAILLSTVLCFASCTEEKISVTDLPIVKAVSELEFDPILHSQQGIGSESYIALINRSNGYTLRFESNDAWELHAITSIAGKEKGESINGCVLDITENYWLLSVPQSEFSKHLDRLNICVSLMSGDKCLGYAIYGINVSPKGMGYLDDLYFTTGIYTQEVFDKPQPYSEVQKAFAEYKAD